MKPRRKILADTHVLLWAMAQPESLSPAARAALADPENCILASAASYWEICIKLSLGKLHLAANWDAHFERELAEGTYEWLPIARGHCRAAADLPFHHRDPFDRLLIAQAIAENAAIVTNDSAFQAYPIPLLW